MPDSVVSINVGNHEARGRAVPHSQDSPFEPVLDKGCVIRRPNGHLPSEVAGQANRPVCIMFSLG
jgi:hypothetical protein